MTEKQERSSLGLNASLKKFALEVSSHLVFSFGCLALWIGVVRWGVALANATLDGEPPIPEYQSAFDEIALIYTISCFLLTIIMFLARRRTAFQWVFAFAALIWTGYVFYAMQGGWDCTYWHHGEINCGEKDNPAIPLFLGANALYLFLLMTVLVRGVGLAKSFTSVFLIVAQNLTLFVAFMSGG